MNALRHQISTFSCLLIILILCAMLKQQYRFICIVAIPTSWGIQISSLILDEDRRICIFTSENRNYKSTATISPSIYILNEPPSQHNVTRNPNAVRYLYAYRFGSLGTHSNQKLTRMRAFHTVDGSLYTNVEWTSRWVLNRKINRE